MYVSRPRSLDGRSSVRVHQSLLVVWVAHEPPAAHQRERKLMTHHQPMHDAASHERMQGGIEACTRCHATCLHSAMTHCLEAGGKNVEAGHFRLLSNCAEICQTSANFMLSHSTFHSQLCALCAEICDACAASCESIGGMEDCVKACRECAQSCRAMATAKH